MRHVFTILLLTCTLLLHAQDGRLSSSLPFFQEFVGDTLEDVVNDTFDLGLTFNASGNAALRFEVEEITGNTEGTLYIDSAVEKDSADATWVVRDSVLLGGGNELLELYIAKDSAPYMRLRGRYNMTGTHTTRTDLKFLYKRD